MFDIKAVLNGLTPKQLEILKYDNAVCPRITILEGAVRSGKTFINNLLWLKHVLQFQSKKFLMTGYTIGSLKRNVLDDLQSLFGIDTSLNQKNQFMIGNNIINCFGADKVDSSASIKGFTAQGWYGNEVTEHHENVIKEGLARCSGRGARIFWDTNPDTPEHAIYKNFIAHSGSKLDDQSEYIKSWHFTLEDNPKLDINYIQSLRRAYPAESIFYRRAIMGEWVAAENVIYNHYAITSVNHLEGFEEIIAGVDFARGGNNAFAFLLLGRNGEEYSVITEAYKTGVLNSEFIEIVSDLIAKLGYNKEQIHVFGDSADPDKIEEWSRAGWWISPADKSPYSVLAGINEVMRHPLFIDASCINTIREIQSYCWAKKKEGLQESPVKFNDHCMDALRYAIYTNSKGAGTVEYLQGIIGAFNL